MAIKFVSYALWNFIKLHGFTEYLNLLCIGKSHKIIEVVMTKAQVDGPQND